MGLKSFLSGLGNKVEKATTLDELLKEWIKKLEDYSQPGKDIKALNFGLFESDEGFMIYLTGSKVYDYPNDDWATETDFEPIALYKYLLLNTDDTKNLEWDQLLEKVKMALENVIAKHPNYHLFKNRTVTVGFDDGDLILIKGDCLNR